MVGIYPINMVSQMDSLQNSLINSLSCKNSLPFTSKIDIEIPNKLNINMPFLFNFNNSGGTEHMSATFNKYIANDLPKLKNYECVIVPGLGQKSFEDLLIGKKIILWIHNLLSQLNPKVREFISSDEFLQKVEYLIVVSEYHKKELIKQLKIDSQKIIVIHNFVDFIENDIERFNHFDKIKVIHSSTSIRGMSIILKSLPKISESFELNIFNDFNPDIFYDSEFKFLLNDKRINFYGPTPRKTLQKYISESHIYLNPSIWEETFCISQAEAISANCLPVYNNVGSLSEISLNSGLQYKAKYKTEKDFNEHIDLFTKNFKDAIDLIKNKKFIPQNQSKKIYDKFSFNVFKDSWKNFHDEKL